VFSNILSNAVKYSPSGGTIRFTCCEEGETLIFCVTDQGIGIPEEDLLHLFESFHRGANVENVKGTGLGLSIVKQFVELHDGTITVESRVQHGTSITVTLPKYLSKEAEHVNIDC
jgi:signal transduction histidine kinase